MMMIMLVLQFVDVDSSPDRAGNIAPGAQDGDYGVSDECNGIGTIKEV